MEERYIRNIGALTEQECAVLRTKTVFVAGCGGLGGYLIEMLLRLGVGMILPEGFEAHIAPRSSTFKNFGILVPNSPGVVDNSYCGEEDEWRLPFYAVRDTVIRKNDRICQFRLVEKQPSFTFVTVEHLQEESRGGFGSTGTN